MKNINKIAPAAGFFVGIAVSLAIFFHMPRHYETSDGYLLIFFPLAFGILTAPAAAAVFKWITDREYRYLNAEEVDILLIEAAKGGRNASIKVFRCLQIIIRFVLAYSALTPLVAILILKS